MTKFYNILKNVISKDDLLTLELLLDQIEKMLFQTNTKPDYQQLIERSDNSLLAEEFVNEISTSANVKDFVSELRKELTVLKYLHLTFSQRPTKSMLAKIGYWVKENLGENIIVDWNVKFEIIGGAEISYEGKYGDYTVRKKLGNWWNDQGVVIKEMLGI